MADPYLKLLGLVALLFFLPKVLQRLRLPSPVTEMVLGVAFGPKLLDVELPAQMLSGLSAFGISSLFLFAGLEVEVDELSHRKRTLLQHLSIQVALFVAAAWVGVQAGLDLAAAVLVAVAIMTPSTGFILSSLDALGLSESVTSWIKQKAIVTEIVAILTVLVFVNTTSSRAVSATLRSRPESSR